jgi:hypothetical protein
MPGGGEHLLEGRDDEDQQDQNRCTGHGEDDGRVDHGALDLPDERVVLLEEGRQAQQDRVEDTAGLTRRDHVHVELGEDLRVLAQGVGERVARLHVVEHL